MRDPFDAEPKAPAAEAAELAHMPQAQTGMDSGLNPPCGNIAGPGVVAPAPWRDSGGGRIGPIFTGFSQHFGARGPLRRRLSGGMRNCAASVDPVMGRG
ncbi:hypothetical protein [Roseovarius amoyensis]|uniref:hypothetical protein n=1 Tax=Roseovarius amoyensis TaxID=2211448 RepID=UPI000DBE8773|nr:hypothetical protein [Roseovarius amoyensis]